MKMKTYKQVEVDATYMYVNTAVRYWEDSEVNGERDIDFHESKGEGVPLMPCAVKIKEKPTDSIYSNHYRWQPIIDIEKGKIINWEEGTTASVHYKVCDEFSCDIKDSNGNTVYEYGGYVPEIMCPKDRGYGDYIIMDIDEKGFIRGWKNHLIKDIVGEEREE
ncbi:hypothetical protein [Bacteroides gallinarum]|uniref:hypothetical protein n=1 Tax=Bacteroides gallinarum TaxID=376806 RepID=UPI0003722D46|nr:hypothetical protein [Bacteroides gallinarum]